MLETLGPKALKYEEFPKIRATLFWGPYNEDPTIWGTILGSPIFGNSHILNQSRFQPGSSVRRVCCSRTTNMSVSIGDYTACHMYVIELKVPGLEIGCPGHKNHITL